MIVLMRESRLLPGSSKAPVGLASYWGFLFGLATGLAFSRIDVGERLSSCLAAR